MLDTRQIQITTSKTPALTIWPIAQKLYEIGYEIAADQGKSQRNHRGSGLFRGCAGAIAGGGSVRARSGRRT